MSEIRRKTRTVYSRHAYADVHHPEEGCSIRPSCSWTATPCGAEVPEPQGTGVDLTNQRITVNDYVTGSVRVLTRCLQCFGIGRERTDGG